MPRRRRPLRYDLMKSRLEIELTGADPEKAQRIRQQLEELEAAKHELQRPVSAAQLKRHSHYRTLVQAWHELLLGGTNKWDELMKIHRALRRLEIVAGVEEDE